MGNILKKKSVRYDKQYNNKIKARHAQSKIFDREYKKKRASIKANYCQKLKQQEELDKSISLSSLKPIDLRTEEGKKRRHQNTTRPKHENENLRDTIRKRELENRRLQSLSISYSNSLSSYEEENNRKEKENDHEIISPSKLLIDSMSPGAKKRASLRLMDKKSELSRGIITNVRQKLGINLSNQYFPPSSQAPQHQQLFI
ncbi:unnamed protein product [Rotaria sp. Silwood2]|nr:unnamed protein product [Rotaria sp. Silwood2]CAF2976412.1 unnamed protein product [Rotaria sp. Silwood2]CAF3117600.1 unnamed protein product [Rotaria sp. Silwood2]CAF4168096.1 unnamed protein product [Rotaria sp. Silwood2]CAF4381518.1 unnamed protein product [Rotaria sp. Silwood2]